MVREIERSDATAFPDVTGVPADTTLEGLFREVGRFLHEVACSRPLLFFLDDLHWSDASTIGLLDFLVNRFALDSSRILIVAAFRPSVLLASAHPFVALKSDLQTRGICKDLTLELLSREDIARYVAARFPLNRFSPVFIDALHAATEGNPLFMVDLVTDLIRRGVLELLGETWIESRGLPDWQADLPRSVRAMVDRTIRQLDAADRSLLSAATIQGLEFNSSILASSAGVARTEIEDRLHVLSSVHGIVRPVDATPKSNEHTDLEFEFVHALHREALHASLTPTRKALVSGAVAQALLERDRDHVWDIASTLALLFEAARDPAQASEYALLAAEHSARLSGYARPSAWRGGDCIFSNPCQ